MLFSKNGNSNGNGVYSANGNGYVSWWRRSLLAWKSPLPDGMAPYRRLALQLHYDLPRSESPRSVLLVTPQPSDSCAHSSMLLASCLGEELGRTVLLVDVCARHPEASRILDCCGERGFSDFLADRSLPMADLVLATSSPGVSFLPAGGEVRGGPVTSPDEMRAVVAAAEGSYDFVVLSGGSVLNDASALALAPHVGCVLLLVEENHTTVEELDAAQHALAFCKARKMGLVLATAAPQGSLLERASRNGTSHSHSE